MRGIFILTCLIIMTAFGCQKDLSNLRKDKLIGNWSTVLNGDKHQLTFYQDSLVLNEFGYTYKGKWSIDSSRIFIEPIKGFEQNAFGITTFDYKINNSLDTLNIKTLKDSVFKYPFIKIWNAYDYLEKINDFRIDLEKRSELVYTGNSSHDINVYVGYKNSELTVKTDRYVNLYNIDSEALELIFISKSIDTSQVNYNLIVDENVPETKVDSIKNILNKTVINKFFRIYTNEKVDYSKTNWKDEINWFGVPGKLN